MLWLVSQTLQRFDPATERFTAYRFISPERERWTAKVPLLSLRSATRTVNSFLSIDHSGVLWVAQPMDCCDLIASASSSRLTTSEMACRPVRSSASSKIATENCGWVQPVGYRGSTPREDLQQLLRERRPGRKRVRGLSGRLQIPARSDVLRQQERAHVILAGPDRRNAIHPACGPHAILVAEHACGAGPGRLLARSITSTPSLTLSHDQNLFSFEFAALSYVDPQRNQYRYMLEPLDDSWNRWTLIAE